MCLCVEVDLVEFWEPGVFNYTTLLLREDRGVLYVGAREVIYELNMNNVSVKSNQVRNINVSLDILYSFHCINTTVKANQKCRIVMFNVCQSYLISHFVLCSAQYRQISFLFMMFGLIFPVYDSRFSCCGKFQRTTCQCAF